MISKCLFRDSPGSFATLARSVARVSSGRPHHDPGEIPGAIHDAGGEPMGGPRYIWWNFVSSRRERIDWKQVRFDSVPGDNEFIPLPEPEPEVVGPRVANYP